MRSNAHGRAYTPVGYYRASPWRFFRAVAALLCALGLLTALGAFAMDRFAALSMLESGDDDNAIGPSGEISRYQILPATWQQYTRGKTVDPLNCTDSLAVVHAVMSDRCAQFQKTNHRPPSDFEFYLLWNCPAHVFHPSKNASDRAQRFANLCQRP